MLLENLNAYIFRQARSFYTHVLDHITLAYQHTQRQVRMAMYTIEPSAVSQTSQSIEGYSEDSRKVINSRFFSRDQCDQLV